MALRITHYDLMMQGQTAPTFAETVNLATKTVPLPVTTFQCGIMLKSTSLILDVMQAVLQIRRILSY